MMPSFEKFQHTPIILASGSPRRRQLLASLDIAFEVKIKDTDERFEASMPASQVPIMLSERKAMAFRNNLEENLLIIAADTIVEIDNKILNKPAHAQEATSMLQMLSGRKHTVVTGVCLLSKNKKVCFSDTTHVYFKTLSSAEIAYYITHYKPYDKAGSYGAQEWLGMIAIERIEGSYFNVMGLPVHLLYEQLTHF